jgi:hypothetical protein
MADNSQLSAAVGSGIVLATDDISSVHYQRVKLSLGVDGSAVDASASNPIPVTLASSGGLTSLQLLDDAIGTVSSTATTKVMASGGIDGSGNAQMQLMDCSGRAVVNVNSMPSITVGAALPAGSNNIGDVDVLSVAAGDNLIGRVKLSDGTEVAAVDSNNRLETTSYQGSTWSVQEIPGTTGGLSISRVVAANSTNATVAKASAGHLYGFDIYNASGATSFVKFVNKASAPTAGSETVAYTVAIPTVAQVRLMFPQGIAFATGISFFTVTGFADSNSTAVAANDLIIQVFYK